MVKFAGSWEDSGCEVRGQFMGHYLSALAFLGNHTSNEALLKRSAYLLKELRSVQQELGEGYLSAFPKEHFQRLRNLQPVWAPFYVVRFLCLAILP